MGTTREALEAALAADPENVALHSAYADLLIEEGDPRGEFIRLELALEDEGLTEDERKAINLRSNSILRNNERNWLGPLYEFVRPIELRDAIWEGIFTFLEIQWSRGWIDSVYIFTKFLETTDTIVQSRYSRMLKSCHLIHLPNEPEIDSFRRIFDSLNTTSIDELAIIGFTIHGDDIVDKFLSSSLCQQVRKLTIEGCGITDTGALALSTSPYVHRLSSLSLDSNYLSQIGIAELAEIGFAIGPQLDNPAWDGGTHAV